MGCLDRPGFRDSVKDIRKYLPDQTRCLVRETGKETGGFSEKATKGQEPVYFIEGRYCRD